MNLKSGEKREKRKEFFDMQQQQKSLLNRFVVIRHYGGELN